MASTSQRDAGLRAWSLLALLVSCGLCFVPLFNLVGYELGLAVAPLATAAAVHLGMIRLARMRERFSRSERERADVRPARTLLGAWLSTVWRALLVLAVPLAVLSLNALRVRNCNASVGITWYLVLPVASAMFGAALGVALGALAPTLAHGWPAVGIAAAVPILAIAWSAARVYFAPPIFAFDPVIGYFAGSLYDENVGVPTALWWARGYHAALGLAILLWTSRWLSGPELRLRRPAAQGRTALTLAACMALGAVVLLYRLGPQLGFRHDGPSISAALGAERVTEHFVIHYRSDGPYAPEMDGVARELEFRYDELRGQLHREPARRVHAFLFGSAAEKQALMGAGRTYIAKPWRYELYVNHEAFPQAVLGHELAHVFGADVGDPLLGVARAGLRLDVGLVEGFAEALTWHGNSLTPDEAVRVLVLLRQCPPLSRVMSPQFWSLPAQQAYVVAGSFVHYLLIHDGAERLQALYGAGGTRASYERIYGRSFSALEAEWTAQINAIDIASSVMERERERILRPSIFHRPCARDLARRIEEARSLSGRGEHEAAQRVYESVCTDEPDDPAHIESVLGEALRRDDRAATEQIAQRLLTHRKTTATQRAAAYSVLGDVAARADDMKAAASSYEQAAALPTEEGMGRLYSVKRYLAARLADHLDGEGAYRDVLGALSRVTPDSTADFTAITEAAKRSPGDALLSYLAARQYSGRDQLSEADASLRSALGGNGLPDERFSREAARLSAEVAFRRKQYRLAADRFSSLTSVGPRAARIDADRWARRARWFADHD